MDEQLTKGLNQLKAAEYEAAKSATEHEQLAKSLRTQELVYRISRQTIEDAVNFKG